MSNPISVSLVGLGAKTVTGVGDKADLGNGLQRSVARLVLNVVAVSGTGTPTMTMSVLTSPDDVTWWSAGSFTASTAVGKQEKCFRGLERYVKASWVISGTTPSFTLSLTGAGHVIYADVSDLQTVGLSANAMGSVTESQQVQSLIAASSVCDRYLQRVYTLPLTAWGDGLRRDCAAIAAWDVMCVRGFRPESTDEVIRFRYEEALKSLQAMQDKSAPPDIEDSTVSTNDAAVIVYTTAPRGW